MGSYGEGRKQLQIYNLVDPSGWGGTRVEAYSEKTRAAVRALGAGDFGVFLDPEHVEHSVGEASRLAILADMAGN